MTEHRASGLPHDRERLCSPGFCLVPSGVWRPHAWTQERQVRSALVCTKGGALGRDQTFTGSSGQESASGEHGPPATSLWTRLRLRVASTDPMARGSRARQQGQPRCRDQLALEHRALVERPGGW